ncbi:RHS repeat-associated core domain-containing protein [Pseudomonas sp. Sample_10]|uniref:RHS repeat-associated core domain-containing protein n=1 Tax=Pseudomonas sp. Sample_10 TaxID=2448269 RepID=UPI001035B02D|nr:RHS repeat-associated core domain-containing protein [Pseudomonas sp. Sample_10]
MPISGQTRRVEPSTATDPLYSRTLLLASDLQQSVLAELDRGGPNPFVYSPYGLQSGVSQAGTHLGFNGQLKERPTGWYHLGNGHRIYNPVLMRFHSPDRLSPFGKGGVNVYVYCSGDPVNFTDPSGEYGQAFAKLIQLSATTALHAGIVTTNLVGTKATGWMLHAARLSTVASTTAIVGTVGQLAEFAPAVYISNVATTVSAVATMVRYTPAIVNGLRAGTLWETVKGNVRNLVKGTAFPTPPKQHTLTLANGQVPGTVEIPMSTFNPAQTPAEPVRSSQLIRQGEGGSRRRKSF